jgi:uncharacterized metal-binding protein YceD (DUF177 family)
MSADGLAFHRWIDPAGRGAPQGAHAFTTTDAERALIAQWLDIPSVQALTAELTLQRTGASEAAVRGTIHAKAELICGVSLEPFIETLDIPVEAAFRRPPAHGLDAAESASGDPEINLDEDEPREWTHHGIDLGALVVEELSLALPDFPRKPGAELPGDLTDPADEPPPNPFAVLKGLADKT